MIRLLSSKNKHFTTPLENENFHIQKLLVEPISYPVHLFVQIALKVITI